VRRAWVLFLVLSCNSPHPVLVDAMPDAAPCTSCMEVACSAIGYASGMATCGADCKRDESACDGCMADPAALECRSFDQPSDQLYISAVATTPDGPRAAVALSRSSISIYATDATGLVKLHDVPLA
jgi:hypothetical protein